MPVQRGRLKPEDDTRIRKNSKRLLDDIDEGGLRELTWTLYQLQVIDTNDKEAILFPQLTRVEKVEKLLNKITFSGSGDSFEKFLNALEKTDFNELAQLLRETDVSDVEKELPYSWVSEVPSEVMEKRLTTSDASRVSFCIGKGYNILFARLGISDVEIDREKFSNPHDPLFSLITNLLVKWIRKEFKKATWKCLLDILIELENDSNNGIHKESACSIDWLRLKKIVPTI